MGNVSRVGVSIEDELLESFDRLNSERGYDNRSEAIRDLIRDALVQSRVEAPRDKAVEVLGSLTLVYDHHASGLTSRMTELQHRYEGIVVSVLHVHINHDDCMELIALRGRADELRALGDALLGSKGVKHGKLFVTLPSRAMTGRAHTPRKHKHLHANSKQTSRGYG